ncbi:unnamed protein product [Effrenium voratum]|uniref:Uncharacterized protein n=1 Tax=Effrenium voratum TaxID=2562239 RepID=A0AA36IMS0_9DINO|nr:unnamed protein product [Effrenium voratum]
MWRLLLVPPSVLAWQAAKAALDSAEALMVQGNLEPAMQKYFEACKTRRALQEETPPDHPLLLPGDGSFRRAGRQKLRHDAEQLEHLVQLQLLPARPFSQVAHVFRQVLEQLPEDLAVVDVGAGVSKAMDRIYNRAVYLTHPGRLPGPALALSAAEAEALRGRFRASELPAEASGCEAQNGVAFADNVLSPAALDALQRWCRESTMWFSTRAGYVAAFMQEAFNAPLLVQLVEENSLVTRSFGVRCLTCSGRTSS